MHNTSPSRSPVSLKWIGALVAAVATMAFVSYTLASGLGHVAVNSNPPGASVLVGGQVVGNTPATLKLPANGKPVRISVRKAGFKPRTVTVTPKAGKMTRVQVTLQK